ncbi:Cyanovirin-N [Aspergillus heteromorphus CBS 117.55]|uniref:Cyanovirin-N n=1 Tax=Aspergillus heteromorphus CBS 117.55 TaxID=1448321 RepID=A0A317WKA1_9EURO|nr:Cyanovirin-N [Aspergillus heteromorphus CBS 117.55]PWY86894.1 Cyanovirin-N [Aspergillus heteromorphus CBS 117.55]
MSFFRTANDIRVDDGHILVANVQRENGEFDESTFDLNECLGNNEGRFQWGGSNFSESAQDIQFHIEGGDNVPVLRARLANSEDQFSDADVNLAEHITNNNGVLEYQEESLL